MTLNFTHHEGSWDEEPATVDATSSATVVYIRKNIEQFTKTDQQTGEEVTLWGYDEAQISHSDYALYLGEENAADIAYVAIMAGIDL